MTVLHFGSSQPAPYRKNKTLNQDAFCTSELSHYLLAVVCDGVSACLAGKDAANLACTAFAEYLGDALELDTEMANSKFIDRLLVKAVFVADAAIQSEFQPGQAVTTLASVLVNKDSGQAWWVNVGDSPGFHISDSLMALMTPMDVRSVPRLENGQTVIRDGMVEMDVAITAALGTGGAISPHIRHKKLQRGDKVIVTSDGMDQPCIDAITKLAVFEERLIQSLLESCSERSRDDTTFALLCWGQTDLTGQLKATFDRWQALDHPDRTALLKECEPYAQELFAVMRHLLTGEGNETEQLMLLSRIGRWLNKSDLISLADRAAIAGNSKLMREVVSLILRVR